MSYCTLQDLIARYSEQEMLQLTDRDRDGVADAAFIAGVITDVDAQIDAHLAGRYALPLSQTPRVLVRIACELAREALALANGARLDDRTPERSSANAARTMLRDIAKGTISIGTPVPAPSTGSVEMTSGGRVFGRGQGGYL